jgi:Na+-transporting NADH:ubiquinone oxidoreductase subunit NqrD
MISSFKNKLLSKQINFVSIVVQTIVIIIIRENFIFLRLVRELSPQGRKPERILRYPSLLVILAKKVHKVFFYDASTKLIYFLEWIRSIEIIFDLSITV